MSSLPLTKLIVAQFHISVLYTSAADGLDVEKRLIGIGRANSTGQPHEI